jgi:crotonobetaine/carnitine-CoA ligase
MARADVLKVRVPPVEERRRLIEAEPLPANIGALLDEAAAAVPDQLAWNFFESGETATYRDALGRVNALANGMARRGIRKGSHVAVMLPNLAAFPITWLALAKLGAVMIPVNIAYTPREMEYVLGNGDAEWLIVHADCLPSLTGMARPPGLSDERIFVLGDAAHGFQRWESLAAGQPATFTPSEPVALDDLMNIQYTSGTTGFPKGCMLSHRYWVTIGKVNARRDGREYKRILAATPFFYMDPQWLLLMSFYQRGTYFAARRQSSSRFMSWLREHRIQFCLFPEIVFKQPPDPRDRENEIVRVNVYGLDKHCQAALEQRFDLVAREAFGMTEVGSGLFMPIEAVDMVGSGSCGKPSPFREARIVDIDTGLPVKQGEIGELQLKGPGMLQGYYKNPEATAAAFQDGWFRTGDLFRQDERGYYYIVGRIKDMIRRAGENIAAREVEAVLRGLPEIVEAAAVPVPDPMRGEEVKAYIVLDPSLTPKDVPPDRIIAHCEANLARFKVPRFIAYCDQFPKTPSGKIAKKVLTQGVPDLRRGSYDRVEGRWL